LRYSAIVLAQAAPISPPVQLPTEATTLLFVSVGLSCIAGIFGWLTNRTVSNSDKRIDTNQAGLETLRDQAVPQLKDLIHEQERQLLELRAELQQNYAKRDDLTRSFSVLDELVRRNAEKQQEMAIAIHTLLERVEEIRRRQS
jgi:hypothetical protein